MSNENDKIEPTTAPKPKRTRGKARSTGVGGLDAATVALIAGEVAKAVASVQQQAQAAPNDAEYLKAIAKKDPSTWTADDKAALLKEHERLNSALESLPFIGQTVAGKLRPGTVIGEGLTREYVPHDQGWFLDIEARRQDRNMHNGKPAELTWPNYGLHEVIYQGGKPFEQVLINGVGFALLPGVPCMLPTPHYDSYRSQLQSLRRHELYFAPPQPRTAAGYLHVNVGDNGKMVAVLLGKGPLDDAAARETKDAKYSA